MEIKALHIPAANMPGEETGTPSAIVFVQLSEKFKHKFKGILH